MAGLRSSLDTAKLVFLIASFSDVESAEKAYKSLRDRDYYDNEITVVMSEVSMKKYFDKNPKEEESDFGNKAAAGAGNNQKKQTRAVTTKKQAAKSKAGTAKKQTGQSKAGTAKKQTAQSKSG